MIEHLSLSGFALLFGAVIAAASIGAARLWSGVLDNHPGPNRVGPGDFP